MGPDGAIYILDWRTDSGGAGKLWGDGVHGRLIFYYLGMGKAYALDRINPEWRAAYRQHTLDELLELGTARLSR